MRLGRSGASLRPRHATVACIQVLQFLALPGLACARQQHLQGAVHAGQAWPQIGVFQVHRPGAQVCLAYMTSRDQHVTHTCSVNVKCELQCNFRACS